MHGESDRRILIVRTDKIGDVTLSLPVVSALKRNFPSSSVDMLLSPLTRELVSGHPHVSEIVIDDEKGQHKSFSGFLQLVALLRSRRYHLAILLHPTFRLALALFLAGIPRRIGSGYRWYQLLFTDKIYEHRRFASKHEVEYNLNMLDPLGGVVENVRFNIRVHPDAIHKIESKLRRNGMNASERFVILHPGSGGSARDWPAYKFAELGDRIVNELGLQVIITGNRDETALVAEVSRRMREKPLLEACQLTMKEYIALIQRSHLFVSNSTGPMHIAAAIATPVIALFPPIVHCGPRRWGPYGEGHAVIMPRIPHCKRCVEDACPFFNCMEGIHVTEVFSAVREILEKYPQKKILRSDRRNRGN
ncbi:MAG: glycosyltransferase family 9 protein [Gemmatimonadota bacterium]|nr:MAG: glycosyltransferase family 9 protein [Gemmatimonadota bacterium]